MLRFYQEVFGLELLRRLERMAFLRRLEAHGPSVTVTDHRWVGWRWLCVADPQGNVVVLVCHDPAPGA